MKKTTKNVPVRTTVKAGVLTTGGASSGASH